MTARLRYTLDAMPEAVDEDKMSLSRGSSTSALFKDEKGANVVPGGSAKNDISRGNIPGTTVDYSSATLNSGADLGSGASAFGSADKAEWKSWYQPPGKIPNLKRQWPESSCALRLFVTTWNLHGQVPPKESDELRKWIPHDVSDRSTHHDIYAIGTQECMHTIQSALACPTSGDFRRFEDTLQKFLGGPGEYVKVHGCHLGAIHIVVFVRASLSDKILKSRKTCVTTGFGKVMGNKGGCLVGFELLGEKFLFVNCHLAAGQKHMKLRTRDMGRILKVGGTRIAGIKGSKTPKGVAPEGCFSSEDDDAEVDASLLTGERVVDLFTQVLFFGDLNARLATTRDLAEIWFLNGDHGALRAKDQLTPLLQGLAPHTQTTNRDSQRDSSDTDARPELQPKAMLNTPCEADVAVDWTHFKEMLLQFPPTYKFTKNTPMELEMSKKKRCPAWCDRVLFKPSNRLRPVSYEGLFSEEPLWRSDHRPVVAQFEVLLSGRNSPSLGSGSDHDRGGSLCTLM